MAVWVQYGRKCMGFFTLMIPWLTGNCNSLSLPIIKRVSYHISLAREKSQSSKFEAQVPRKSYHFYTIIKLENTQLNHVNQGPSVL